MKKKLLAFLLCAAMVLALTACGGGGGAASAPAVGDPSQGEASQSGESQSGETAPDTSKPTDSGEAPAVPEKSEPLDEYLGLWFMLHDGELDNVIYIREDGVWGQPANYIHDDDYSKMDAEGNVVYSGGVLSILAGDARLDFRTKDGTLTSDQDAKATMIRMQKLFEAEDTIDLKYIGCWKDNARNEWMVIGSDAKWYTLDANNQRITGGFIYAGALSGGNPVLVPEDHQHTYMLVDVEGSGGQRMMDTSTGRELRPVDTLPDGSGNSGDSGLMHYFTGLWQPLDSSLDRTAPCIYIEADGSYITVNKENEVIASGKIEPGENRQVSINVDGSGDVVWTLMEEGSLFDGGSTAMIRLSGNGTPDAETMKDIVGWYAGYDWDKILCVNEDATWAVLDKNGSELDGGVISVDLYQEYGNRTGIVFIPESKAYPIIGDQGFNDQYTGFDVERIPVGEIPEMMKYVGLWKWDYKDKSVLVKFGVSGYMESIGLVLEGAEVDADGKVISEFSYNFFRDPDGKLMLEGDGDYGKYHGFRYELHEDAAGCLCNLQNEKILTPVK